MNTYKTSEDNIFQISCDIIDAIEDAISLPEYELYRHIEGELGYSLSHIRDIFKLATDISLSKYIRRRKYTLILLKITYDDFCELRIQSTISKIRKFKYKCLREFPTITTNYSEDFMQPKIDKSLLRDLIRKQLEKEGESRFFKSLYKDIVENRLLVEIKDDTKYLILQTSDNIIVDLDTTYFTYKNKVFSIKAKQDIVQNAYKDPFLDQFLGNSAFLCPSIQCSANEALQQIYLFFSSCNKVDCSYSVFLDWCDADEWGYSNLISSTICNGIEISDITFNENPFIIFDDSDVVLDLTFFDRK